jgi:hypothetical protein
MTILLIWALEFSKCGWHGRWRKNSFLLMVHGGAASGLLSLGLQPYDPAWALAVPVLAVLPVVLSYHFLWPDPPTGKEFWGKPLWIYSKKYNYRVTHFDLIAGTMIDKWEQKPGPDRWHLLSALSSWPVEMVALWNLGSWNSSVGSQEWLSELLLVGCYALVASSVPFALWTGLSGKIHPALAMRPWKADSMWVKLWRKI